MITQLSLYDNELFIPAPPARTVPDKEPWQMTAEEYELWEETIIYHKRPSVSGNDNPFEEWLYGQEASVFLALKAGITVPPEVLDRFEELKEWHETGSSPQIRANQEHDRQRQHEVDSRPPVGTEEIYQESGRVDRRVIYLNPSRFEYNYQESRKKGDIAAAYSGDTISNPRPVVRKPFQFESQKYIQTGTGPLKDSVSAYLLLPAARFVGTAISYSSKVISNPKDAECKYPGDTARNDPLGFYHGIEVISAGKPHVLVGPPVIFRPGKPTATTL